MHPSSVLGAGNKTWCKIGTDLLSVVYILICNKSKGIMFQNMESCA